MMRTRQFQVPDDKEFLDVLGVLVETTDEEFVKQVRLVAFDQEEVLFSYDQVGRSIRCIWSRNGRPVMHVFREGAVRLAVSSAGGERRMQAHFELDGLAGSLQIRVVDGVVNIEDSLLLV